MMEIRIAIVEDEPIAQEILTKYIKKSDNLRLTGTYKNALEAIDNLSQNQVDLILLDIEMPGMNGLSMLKQLKNPPKVIITTAYREYALEGFELNVVDYLLKPISLERFSHAINRLFSFKEFMTSPESPSNDFQYFKSGGKLIQVYLNEILYIEGLSNYVKIVTTKSPVVVYQKMSYLEEKLPREDFIRIHKSFIVSSSRISTLSTTHVEIDGKKIPVGEKYRENVSRLIERQTAQG